MPEYLSPGVYIEEIEIGAKPIEGVSTSNAGFLGLTERGPTDVRLVTSFGQYQQLYGGHLNDSFMTFAVDGFFRNGGQRCFVGRVVRDGATAAELDIGAAKLEAIGPGAWGRRIGILIQDGSLTSSTRPNFFKLIIGYWKEGAQPGVSSLSTEELFDTASVLEVYDNLSPDASSQDFYETKVNNASRLVKITANDASRPANSDPVEFSLLEDAGEDGTDLTPSGFSGDSSQPPDERVGLAAFEQVDEINIVYAADLYKATSGTDQIVDAVVSHCENMRDRFAVLDAAQGNSNITGIVPPKDSKYAAFYYPWVESFNPLTNGTILLPPGGFVAGIYARSDNERGVHKAPANEVVRGATGLEFKITKGEHDILNPKGVNVIRAFPGRGIRVWGARTTSSDPLWKYVNVRRLFLFLEESIDEGTQWVVFEPNNEQLWARVKQSVTQFLTTQWRAGALMGTTPEEAFFVRVDRSTMTQDDIDNGRLIVLIGVAPTKPAEFVIFRIAQFTAGSENV